METGNVPLILFIYKYQYRIFHVRFFGYMVHSPELLMRKLHVHIWALYSCEIHCSISSEKFF